MFSFEKKRLTIVASVVALLFILFFLLRILFLVGFSGIENVPDITTGIVAWALYLGAKFDLRLALLTAMPVIILAYLPRIGLFHAQATRNALTWYLTTTTLLLLIFYAFDLGHYDYLARRIDSTVIRFRGDASISAEMLWQSYPVLRILVAIVIATAIWQWLYRRVLHAVRERPETSRVAYWHSVVICFLLVFGGIFGRLGTQVPLRWSEAYFTDDDTVAAVALNPVLYFADTYKNREDIVDEDSVREHYAAVADYLGVAEPDPARLNYLRTVPPTRSAQQPGAQRPNVIVIMLESLGAVRLGAFGNPLEPSPNLDRLAEEGMLFTHFLVPVPGTARTVFTSITGLPDVSRVETATRNPMITEQHTIINHLTGYRKFYFTGGSAGWANMRALVRHNIPDLELYEEGSYSEPEVDVWGISDLSLFREVDRVLATVPGEQPFFAYIQTAGNHRPFTIPEDNDGFEVDPLDEETARAHGFTTTDQYNAVRFLDHAIGRFFEMAERSGYLERSIVVMFGDHNNRITTLPHMPPAYERLDLESLLVPFIIYGQGIEPRRIDATMSLMDLMPTIAGLLGIGYHNSTLGRDIFAEEDPARSLARWVYVQLESKRTPRIGMVNRDYLVSLWYDGTGIKLHDLHAPDPERDISAMRPELTARQAFLAKGLYETTKYIMYHNPRLPPVTLTPSDARQ